MRGRLPRHPVRLALLAALALAVGVGWWVWRGAGQSTEVSREAAVAAFRDAGAEAAEARPAPGVPRAGVYTYRQRGDERGAVGPLAVERDLPARARYTVTPWAGGYAEELALSAEHVEGARLRMAADGAHVTWRRTDVTFLAVGRDDRRELRPAPLHLPRDLRPGRAWGGSYRAGGLDVSYRSRVAGRARVDVAGRAVPAVIVRVRTTTRGAHPGRRVDTLWWSPARALPLRWRIAMRITGTVSLRTDSELVLEGLDPVR